MSLRSVGVWNFLHSMIFVKMCMQAVDVRHPLGFVWICLPAFTVGQHVDE